MERSNPGEEDRRVLEDIEGFYEAFDEAERTFRPPVLDPGSDSASDRDLIPDLHIALVPFDLLGVAIDHFHTLRRLSGQPPGGHAEWPARSPWTLLRAALEIASQAIWLVCDDDQGVRVERFLRFHYDDHRQFFVADSLTYVQKDRRKITTPDEFDSEFSRLYQRWDTPDSHNRIRTDINIVECVEEAARQVNIVPEDVAVMFWRTASGYAHGRT